MATWLHVVQQRQKLFSRLDDCSTWKMRRTRRDSLIQSVAGTTGFEARSRYSRQPRHVARRVRLGCAASKRRRAGKLHRSQQSLMREPKLMPVSFCGYFLHGSTDTCTLCVYAYVLFLARNVFCDSVFAPCVYARTRRCTRLPVHTFQLDEVENIRPKVSVSAYVTCGEHQRRTFGAGPAAAYHADSSCRQACNRRCTFCDGRSDRG